MRGSFLTFVEKVIEGIGTLNFKFKTSRLGYSKLNIEIGLSSELIWEIDHHREVRKLTFRALALRQSELGNYGLLTVYTKLKGGATLLIGI